MFGKYKGLERQIADLRGDMAAGFALLREEIKKRNGSVVVKEKRKKKSTYTVRPRETRDRIKETIKIAVMDGVNTGHPYTMRDLCNITGYDYKTVSNYVYLLEDRKEITRDMVTRDARGHKKVLDVSQGSFL